MHEVTFNQLSPTEWDAERETFDCGGNDAAASRLRLGFHIRLEQDDYVIDVFDNSIEDADEACITTHSCETWEQVVAFCSRYDGVTVI